MLLGGHPELTASIPKVAPFLGPQERGKGVGPSFLRKVPSVAVKAATEGQGKTHRMIESRDIRVDPSRQYSSCAMKKSSSTSVWSQEACLSSSEEVLIALPIFSRPPTVHLASRATRDSLLIMLPNTNELCD